MVHFCYAFSERTPSLVPVLCVVTKITVSFLFQSLLCFVSLTENGAAILSQTHTAKPSHSYTLINSRRRSNFCPNSLPVHLSFIKLLNNGKTIFIKVRQIQPLKMSMLVSLSEPQFGASSKKTLWHRLERQLGKGRGVLGEVVFPGTCLLSILPG